MPWLRLESGSAMTSPTSQYRRDAVPLFPPTSPGKTSFFSAADGEQEQKRSKVPIAAFFESAGKLLRRTQTIVFNTIVFIFSIPQFFGTP